MLYPFLELDFWSIPPRGYINLLVGQTPPPARRYRLRFLREASVAPTIVSVLGSGSPILVESDDTRDTRFGACIPTKLSATLIVQPHWQTANVYPKHDRDVQVQFDEIINSSTIEPRFRGWLLAAAGTEQYDAMPYTVTFTASCGLSTLKERPVVTLAGAYPTSPQARLRLLESLLAQTGLGLPLTSVCNLTPVSDRVNPSGKDPLARLFNNGEAFRPPGDDPPSARDVLDAFCEDMDAVLMQWAGRWWFVRVNELSGGWVPPMNPAPGSEEAYVRYYPATADNPDGSIAPTTGLVTFTQPVGPGYAVKVERGAATEPQPLVPRIVVKQSFGKPQSRLINGDFSAVSGVLPTNWSKYDPDHNSFSRLGDGKPENPFRLHIDGAGTNELGLTYHPIGLKQRVIFPVGTRSMGAMRLQGRFRLKNARAAKIVVWAYSPGSSFYSKGYLLNEDGRWLYDPPRYERYGIEIENVNRAGNAVTTRTEWADFDLALNPFSAFGGNLSTQDIFYEVGLCQANTLPGAQAAERWVEYAEVVLIDAVENAYTGRKYTVVNQVIPASNLPVKDEQTLTLTYADAAFAPVGTTDTGLLMVDPVTAELVPAYGFDKPSVPNAAGTGAPLALWCAQERAAQVALPAQRFDGTLLGDLLYGPLTILRFTDWTSAGRSQIVRFAWTVADHAWEVSALEIRRTALGELSAAYLVDGGEISFTPETVGGTDWTDTTPSLPKKKKIIDDGGIIPFRPLIKYDQEKLFWLDGITPVDDAKEIGLAPTLTVRKGGSTILEIAPLVRKAYELQ